MALLKNIFLFSLLTISFFLSKNAMAQEDSLMNLLLDEKVKPEKVRNTWKATRVINGESSEQVASGVLDFRVLHRFGFVNTGAENAFGLDQATMRLGIDYGINDWITAGLGRSNYKKELDAYIKAKPIWQTKGPDHFPFSLSLLAGMTMNTMPWENENQNNYFTSKLCYFYEAIVARKFNDAVSMQLSPAIVHRNLVDSIKDEHDVWALGVGARIKLSKRISFNIDYFALKPGRTADLYANPLSIGFDIETGGHVFQLHFTNATGMNERAFLTETTGKWQKGDVHFGFNISRVFTIGNRRSHRSK
jgi:hypothetical protein